MSEVQVEFDYDAHESNGSVELFANATGDIATYEWNVNGNQVGSTEVLVTDMAPGSINEVELTVINTDGCFAKTHRTVAVEDNYSIPSAFSPNNDGKNDFFRLDIDEHFTDFKIEIYDRWGQLIYHSSDQYFTWKGEENTTGILNMYVYKLNGTTIGGTKVEKTGTLSVVN
jgi:gliding motility-associated-like protein